MSNREFPHTNCLYDSPLDRLDFSMSNKQEYSGTVGLVCEELEKSLNNPSSEESIADIILHPPRIIRAVLDYKIEHPDIPYTEDLVKAASQLVVSTYLCAMAFKRIPLEEIKKFREEKAVSNILGTPVSQVVDPVTWDAMNPAHTEGTANYLGERFKGKNVLFIILGHGGIVAGIDCFLRYNARYGGSNEAYPVRFSRKKHNDQIPQLSTTEISYVKELAKNRGVVIFDEDMLTGGTLALARTYFQKIFDPTTELITIANTKLRINLASSTKIIELVNFKKNYSFGGLD